MDISDLLKSIKPFNSLGMSMEEASAGRVVLNVPLSENINDKKTMFAGSIYSATVLCGWALSYMTLNVNSKEYDVVIRHSDIDYRLPVKTDARAVAEFNGEMSVKPNGKISIPVKVKFLDDSDALCAEFSGEYIGIRVS